MEKDIVIIGGGPAGMAAAISAFDSGTRSILVIERDEALGGILQQCIHNGFGLTRFKENMTGPEYAERFIGELKNRNIEVLFDTTVLSFSKENIVTATNSNLGIFTIKAKAIILAMGCRERSKGALNIGGFRGAGILSAGTAQKYINIKGLNIGKDVVILGSGDIGLIMARRLTLEGARVHAVLEIMPHSSGLRRNIVQCLDDFSIPLYLSHTIVRIEGRERVSGVVVASVDKNKMPIKSTERFIKCDTVLFSVGLIPENELTLRAGIDISPKTKGAIVNQYRQTSQEGVFACGNVLQVHDLVDFVSLEAEIAGKSASEYVQSMHNAQNNDSSNINVLAGENVGYVVPQIIKQQNEQVKLFFRPTSMLKGVEVVVMCGERIIYKRKKLAVAPGEMENITIDTANLSDDIVINIR